MLKKKIVQAKNKIVVKAQQVAPKVSKAAKRRARAAAKQAVSSVLNRGLQAFIGAGDYVAMESPNTNSLINPTVLTTVPQMSNKGRRGVRVVESEFVGDILSGPTLVAGSTAFNNTVYTLNPQNSVLFPWLSSMAPLFDQWEPNGIILRFKSTSSEFNGVSQGLGVVVGAADYDAADASYSSKVEMENADYSVSCKASESFLMGIECDPSERPTRVLFTGLPSHAQTPANLHDLCRVQIATQGMSAAGVTIGELWIDYDITFYKKQLSPISPILPYVNRWCTFTTAAAVPADENMLYPYAEWDREFGLLPCVIGNGVFGPYIEFPASVTASGETRFLLTYSIHATTPVDGLSAVIDEAISGVSFNGLDTHAVVSWFAVADGIFNTSASFTPDGTSDQQLYLLDFPALATPGTFAGTRRITITQIDDSADYS